MSIVLAEAYMTVVVQTLREALDSASQPAVVPAAGGVPPSSSSGNVGSHTAAGGSTDPPEECVTAVLKRAESRIAQLLFSGLGTSAYGGVAKSFVWRSVDDTLNSSDAVALCHRMHVGGVVDVILAVRGALANFFASAGVNAALHDDPLSLSTGMVAVIVTRFLFGAASSNARPSNGSAASTPASMRAAGSPHGMVSPTAAAGVGVGVGGGGGWSTCLPLDVSFARRCYALVDIIWLHSMFVLFGEMMTQPRRPIALNRVVDGDDRNNSGAPRSASPARTPPRHSSSAASPTTVSAAPSAHSPHSSSSPTLKQILAIPLTFFMRRQQILDIENIVCTWILRDVDVYPAYRKLIQQWSIELFSLICSVDSSVTSPMNTTIHESTARSFAEFVERMSTRGISNDTLPESQSEALDTLFLHFVYEESKGSSSAPSESSVVPAHRESSLPVLVGSSLTFVEKYIKGMLSILSDLSVYKNYSGLLKYARLLSSLRIESNALFITLTSVLVELATACKGRKEVKIIFAEFAVRLLFPTAHTPRSQVDAWVLRNCEFIQMQHLNEWEGKPKYISVVIPALAACLGGSSIPFFVRQVIPFCHLVAKSLPDADRRVRQTYFLSLHHVLGVCFKHVLTHQTLSQDSAAASLRREIFHVLQNDVINSLRKQAITTQSAKVIEAATELFLLLIKFFPAEGVAMIVDLLLPAEASLVLSEATAVGLSVLAAISDTPLPSSPGVDSPQQPQRWHRIALLTWSSLERTVIPPRLLNEEETLAYPGIALMATTSPFVSLRKSCCQPSSSSEDDDDDAAAELKASSCHSYCYAGRDVLVGPNCNNVSLQGGPLGGAPLGAAAVSSSGMSSDGTSGNSEEDLESVYRRLGAAMITWDGDGDESNSAVRANTQIAVCRDSLRSREDVILKKMALIFSTLKDAWVVPPSARGSQQRNSAASVVYLSSISEKEKMAHRLLVTAMLVGRYWSPFSALFAEIPRSLVHVNNAIVVVATSVLIPHFQLHSEYQMFGQVVLSRLVEALALAIDDRDAVYSYARALVDMSFTYLRELQRCRSKRATTTLRTRRAQYETFGKHFFLTPSLPSAYYILPPLYPIVPATDMQNYSLMDLLDGAAWMLLGNADPNVRFVALTLMRNVAAMAESMCAWRSELLVGDASADFEGSMLPPSSSSANSSSLLDWSGWYPVGDMLRGVQGKHFMATCKEHIDDCQSVGCHWPDESKAFRLVGLASIYGRPRMTWINSQSPSTPSTAAELIAAQQPFLRGSKRTAPAAVNGSIPFPINPIRQFQLSPRLIFISSQQGMDTIATRDTTVKNGGDDGVHLLQAFVVDSVLPSVLVGNFTIDAISAGIAWLMKQSNNMTSDGVSKSYMVAAKLCALACAQTSSSTWASEDRYVVDCWKSALSTYFLLIHVEPATMLPLMMKQQQQNASNAPSSTAAAANAPRPKSVQRRTSTGEATLFDVWGVPEKPKRATECFQWITVAMAKCSGTQDIFDSLSYLFSKLIPRVLDQPALLSVTQDFVRQTTDFVKKFLDDPVKAYARKDKKRALAYCSIASPALHCCAYVVLCSNGGKASSFPSVPQTATRKAQSATASVPPQLNLSSAAPSSSITTNNSSTTSTTLVMDTQLLLVKLFDALDTMIAVLITGNFSSTVGGSNAPTSTSSTTLTPQQHELVRTGGVSPLAALPPIPSLKFHFFVTPSIAPGLSIGLPSLLSAGSSPLISSVSGQQRQLPAEMLATGATSDSQLLFDASSINWGVGTETILRDDQLLSAFASTNAAPMDPHSSNASSISTPTVERGANVSCVFSRTSWAHTRWLTYEQSFSVRLRLSLVELFGLFLDSELPSAQFLRERHRIMLEFLFFNVFGTLTQTSLQSVLMLQMQSKRTHGISSRRMLFAARGEPTGYYSLALQQLVFALMFKVASPEFHLSSPASATTQTQRGGGGSAIPEALALFMRVVDNVLEYYLASLSTLSSFTTSTSSSSPERKNTNNNTTNSGGPSFLAHSCFDVDSPFRETIERISRDSSWGHHAFKLFCNRLSEVSFGTATHQFFANIVFIFLLANPKRLLEDDSSGAAVAVISPPDLSMSGTASSAFSTSIQSSHHYHHQVQQLQRRQRESQPPSEPRPLRDCQKSPLLTITAVAIVSVHDPSVCCVSRRDALDTLCLLYGDGNNHPKDNLTSFSDGSYCVTQLVKKLLLPHKNVMYSPQRNKNQYNRLLEIVLYYLTSQRMVLSAAWLNALFGLTADVLEVVELSDDKLKALVSVSKAFMTEIGDAMVTRLFAAINRSSETNKAKLGYRILWLSAEEQRFILEHTPVATTVDRGDGQRAPSTPSSAVAGKRPAHSPISEELPSVVLPIQKGLKYYVFCQVLYQLVAAKHSPLWNNEKLSMPNNGLVDEAGGGSAALPDAGEGSTVIKQSIWEIVEKNSSEKRTPATSTAPTEQTFLTSQLPPSFFNNTNVNTTNSIGSIHFHEGAMNLPQCGIFDEAARSLESTYLKALRSVLRCFTLVSPDIMPMDSLLCDAAVEVGIGEQISRSTYVRNYSVAPCSSSLPDSPNAHLGSHRVTPAQKTARRYATSPPPPLPPKLVGAGAFPSDPDDVQSIRSDASGDTVVIHDEVEASGCGVIPALLTNVSNNDELSLKSDGASYGRSGHPSGGGWYVDAEFFKREVKAAVTNQLLLAIGRAISQTLSCVALSQDGNSCSSCQLFRNALSSETAAVVTLLKDLLIMNHESLQGRLIVKIPEHFQRRGGRGSKGEHILQPDSNSNFFSPSTELQSHLAALDALNKCLAVVGTSSLASLDDLRMCKQSMTEANHSLFLRGGNNTDNRDPQQGFSGTGRDVQLALWVQLLGRVLPVRLSRLWLRYECEQQAVWASSIVGKQMCSPAPSSVKRPQATPAAGGNPQNNVLLRLMGLCTSTLLLDLLTGTLRNAEAQGSADVDGVSALPAKKSSGMQAMTSKSGTDNLMSGEYSNIFLFSPFVKGVIQLWSAATRIGITDRSTSFAIRKASAGAVAAALNAMRHRVVARPSLGAEAVSTVKDASFGFISDTDVTATFWMAFVSAVASPSFTDAAILLRSIVCSASWSNPISHIPKVLTSLCSQPSLKILQDMHPEMMCVLLVVLQSITKPSDVCLDNFSTTFASSLTGGDVAVRSTIELLDSVGRVSPYIVPAVIAMWCLLHPSQGTLILHIAQEQQHQGGSASLDSRIIKMVVDIVCDAQAYSFGAQYCTCVLNRFLSLCSQLFERDIESLVMSVASSKGKSSATAGSSQDSPLRTMNPSFSSPLGPRNGSSIIHGFETEDEPTIDHAVVDFQAIFQQFLVLPVVWVMSSGVYKDTKGGDNNNEVCQRRASIVLCALLTSSKLSELTRGLVLDVTPALVSSIERQRMKVFLGTSGVRNGADDMDDISGTWGLILLTLRSIRLRGDRSIVSAPTGFATGALCELLDRLWNRDDLVNGLVLHTADGSDEVLREEQAQHAATSSSSLYGYADEGARGVVRPWGLVPWPVDVRHAGSGSTASVDASADGLSSLCEEIGLRDADLRDHDECSLPTPQQSSRQWLYTFVHTHGSNVRYMIPQSVLASAAFVGVNEDVAEEHRIDETLVTPRQAEVRDTLEESLNASATIGSQSNGEGVDASGLLGSATLTLDGLSPQVRSMHTAVGHDNRSTSSSESTASFDSDSETSSS